MSPRSPSRSISPRRSYSRTPRKHSGRRKSYSPYGGYDSSCSSNSRRPPSPPPLTIKRSCRYSSASRSTSRSISPSYKKRRRSGRHTRSRSRTTSRNSYNKSYRNSRDQPFPCRCIGVFGLSVFTTQIKIRSIFEKYGPIERIQVVIDAKTGRSRGFCFIYYENLADAKAACDNCCGMEIDGRQIRVAFSVTERPHTPTPGVYKGQLVSKRYRAHSPSSYSKSHRHRYERSRSRSYSPRRYRN